MKIPMVVEVDVDPFVTLIDVWCELAELGADVPSDPRQTMATMTREGVESTLLAELKRLYQLQQLVSEADAPVPPWRGGYGMPVAWQPNQAAMR